MIIDQKLAKTPGYQILLLGFLITLVKEECGHPLRGKIHVYQQLHTDAETSGTSISSTRHAA